MGSRPGGWDPPSDGSNSPARWSSIRPDRGPALGQLLGRRPQLVEPLVWMKLGFLTTPDRETPFRRGVGGQLATLDVESAGYCGRLARWHSERLSGLLRICGERQM